MIPSPFDVEERLEVLALNNSHCVVDLGFSIESVVAGSYFFDEASSYADGFLEINRPIGHILQEGRTTRFDFTVKAKPSRDFTDCYVVLRLYAMDGREFLLPFEIPDLEAEKAASIRISPELAFDDLNRGVYHYHFFSGGEEIYFAPTEKKLGKRNGRLIPVREIQSREPEIERVASLEVPQSLASAVTGEEALIAIGVNDKGYSVDHTVLSETSPIVARVALRLIKNSRFKPGAEGGFFQRKDLLLRVRFDARGRPHCAVE
ncbi:hypothetical protein [Pelagicoccus albus]|uniref:Uncharacterized protein n=1 Tax=Pelagicoccus albus TaxID=415222 RepID=A0A7X1E8P2_9BACT|nr:hypothetical protein [Pelagicoccus albus]MBC2606501.1 hypothetical protein [Pelagicoccus albus]